MLVQKRKLYIVLIPTSGADIVSVGNIPKEGKLGSQNENCHEKIFAVKWNKSVCFQSKKHRISLFSFSKISVIKK